MTITGKRTQELLGRFTEQTILVVGDLMLDRYVTGTVSRISPEAPVPVVHVTQEHVLPGGAANVALNIQQLGAQAVVSGLVGADEAGRELCDVLERQGIATHGVVRADTPRTTVKTRIVAERQQVVRVDREDRTAADTPLTDRLCEAVRKSAAGATGVVVEDYGKGAVTQSMIDCVVELTACAAIPVGFDPKENHALAFPALTMATPNYREACLAAGLPFDPMAPPLVPDGETGECAGETLAQAGKTLLDRWHAEFLIVTLGPHGMYLLSRGQAPRIIPTRAREVFDVSGAGDTVIATALLALAAGASHNEAATLANHAAGIVVAKLGSASCSPDELLDSVSADA